MLQCHPPHTPTRTRPCAEFCDRPAPQVFLAGASGGVYAILAAHLADLIMNWAEMEFAIVRLLFLMLLVGTDVGVAVYGRYTGTGNNQVRKRPSRLPVP